MLTIAFYFLAVCLILEFCRIAITTSYWDLAVTESVRISKNEYDGKGSYLNVFKNNLQKQLNAQEKSTLGNFLQLDKNMMLMSNMLIVLKGNLVSMRC